MGSNCLMGTKSTENRMMKIVVIDAQQSECLSVTEMHT